MLVQTFYNYAKNKYFLFNFRVINLVQFLSFASYRTDDAFERKKKDVFKIKTTDLGSLKKLM